MPDAELRRQRLAFNRGVLGSAAVTIVILFVVGTFAIRSASSASRARAASERFRKMLYLSDVSLAWHQMDDGVFGFARELLNEVRPNPREKDLRDWEWG